MSNQRDRRGAPRHSQALGVAAVVVALAGGAALLGLQSCSPASTTPGPDPTPPATGTPTTTASTGAQPKPPATPTQPMPPPPT